MKYLFFAILAFALTGCQQGPLVKSEPFDWEKAVVKSAERKCRDKKGTALYGSCYERELATGRSQARQIAAQFNIKLR